MKNHPPANDGYNRHTNNPTRQGQKTTVFNEARLVSRLLYAIVFIGFFGYYMDKALEIVRH
jgi:hypothetical protein